METDDLVALKDDMVAFIEGHGMRRFASVAVTGDATPSCILCAVPACTALP